MPSGSELHVKFDRANEEASLVGCMGVVLCGALALDYASAAVSHLLSLQPAHAALVAPSLLLAYVFRYTAAELNKTWCRWCLSMRWSFGHSGRSW